ncbi:uncharacterized protein LOC132738870 [Ruditapes philippinarum]|uniref:uncharacterized protein LOC132738870 n=1 Tax=Ruditapes philippinarum TaxID=129788 RepID=UPI00295AAE3D|nr:uncharacterized protein LOC132738870 [Ruditapes philippinarum]
MATANFGIPDFEYLESHSNNSAKEDTAVAAMSESMNDDLSSESDTKEVYISSDDMVDSTEWSIDSCEFALDGNIDTSNVEQLLDISVDIDTDNVGIDTAVYNVMNLDNEINEFQETSSVLNDYESPVFSNLPNLPTAGLFGVTDNNEMPIAEATESSSAVQSETLSPTNLPNFTEMDSNTSHGTVSENKRANEEGPVHSRDYMPKLEVLTERFGTSFTLGRTDNGPSGCERPRNNVKTYRKRRIRRKSKH